MATLTLLSFQVPPALELPFPYIYHPVLRHPISDLSFSAGTEQELCQTEQAIVVIIDCQ